MERRERRHHTREFKLEAVRLAAIGDKTTAKVARELGVRVNQLRQWRLDFSHCDPGQASIPISAADVLAKKGNSLDLLSLTLWSDRPVASHPATWNHVLPRSMP